MALNIHKAYIGTTSSLARYQWPKNQRSTGEVRVSYEDADGDRQIVTICPEGARTLARALKENADLIDPPKPRRRRS